MKKDFPITELPSKNSVSIDKLSTFEGLKLMLEDQKKAILAVKNNIDSLQQNQIGEKNENIIFS